MCMVLYAAADVPLPTIDTGNPPPLLSVQLLGPDEQDVRVHFSKRHAYVLGAHTGCSCGFSYGDGDGTDAWGRESVRRLSAYLASAVERAGPIELFACWNGDETKPLEIRATITPGEFDADRERFALAERWLAVVVSGTDAADRGAAEGRAPQE
ncbi:MAG TPA: hypothetical protein VJ803_07915 [Gemmatimonadaceae bacterium]|nr:hypothetical protein [Gemmatimonadaceae bacterium]